jgi:type VI secretion system protein ImpE
MTAIELFQAGRLEEARTFQERVVAEQPSDAGARLLLAEFLLYCSDLNAVREQLRQLPADRPGMDEFLTAYHALIDAETKRQSQRGDVSPVFLLPPPEHVEFRLRARDCLHRNRPKEAVHWLDEAEACGPWVAGHVDGREFDGARDVDELFGPVLELFLDDQFVWFPFEEVRKLRIGAIESLRDRCFVPAELTSRDGQFWRVHLPALYPSPPGHTDEEVRAGLSTDWHAEPDGPMRGVGLRQFTFGGEDLSFEDFRQWEA